MFDKLFGKKPEPVKVETPKKEKKPRKPKEPKVALSDKEKATIKDAAKSLLERLKKNEFNIIQWSEKIQTSSSVKRQINNYLFEQLPYPTYQDKDIEDKTEMLFNEFKERYANYVAA